MDAQCARNARPYKGITRLPFFFSQRSPLSDFRRAMFRKRVIHKRVETLVSTLLCPCRVGKIPLASQATTSRNVNIS